MRGYLLANLLACHTLTKTAFGKSMTKLIMSTAIAFAAIAFSASGAHAQDVAAGETVFKKCQACHTVAEGGANKVGPNLWGIIGSTAGARDNGFRYSSALADSGVAWTDDSLDQYLADPRGFIKGNRMAFAGLRKDEDRANVIAYLKSSTQ